MVSRRAFLAGTFASLAQGAFALPPEVSRIPLRRPDGFELRTLPSAAELIARADLGGAVSCVVADANTGEVLEAVSPLLGLPPASVTKAMTAAYALDRLGPGYRFRTQLIADGTLSNGRLEGDLWLVGGADPLLDTDALNAMARDLADDNIRVNAVAPGIIRTRFHEAMTPETQTHNLANRIPLHREGTVQDVAEVVHLLATNEFITGETYVIDGGMSMQMVR